MINTHQQPAGTFVFRTIAHATIALLLTAAPAFAEKKPLKVIILAGQSNMQKPANWQMLKGLADSPQTKPLYDKLVDENGMVRIFPDVREAILDETTTDENGNVVAIPNYGSPVPHKFGGLSLEAEEADSAGQKGKSGKKDTPRPGGNFGPEYGFAITLHEQLKEPLLIIKTAWGGKSLYKDFRPPTGTDWVPPAGHPDHPDSAPKPLPIPETFELPAGFQPPAERAKNMQIFSGLPIGEVNGLYPVYVMEGYGDKGELKGIPIEKGDLILGVNGAGLPKDPIKRWRDVWFNEARAGDWTVKITRWRDGKIETFTIDTAQTLEGGRASAAAYVEEQKAARQKLVEEGGEYYAMMMKRIREVLADPGKYHPAYDPEQGVELAGFVWFQGYNDFIASTVYPNGNKRRGYEQYSWLLAELIRNVRKELNAPELPVIVGVFGQGGDSDTAVHFREAQAAVADYDEFKGRVVAVQTKDFNDARIPEIQGKLERVMDYRGNDPDHPYSKLQEKIRVYEKEMGDPEKLEGKQKYRLIAQIKKGVADVVKSEEEKDYLKNNVSNQGYHYYGSPKFFIRVGEAFAKAWIEIQATDAKEQ